MSMASLVGFRFFERRYPRGWEARFSWAEVTSKFGLAFALCLFEDNFSLHLHLGWPNMFIKLPFLQRWHREPHEMMESWGLSWVGPDAIHMNWGSSCKILHMPWSAQWVRTSILLEDGTWAHELRSRRKVEFPNYPLIEPKIHCSFLFKIKKDVAWRETYPYRYLLRSGEFQDRQATIVVEEREWRWRWFTWLPFPRGIERSIDVSFDHEVGEKSGSWKGGVMGCGYTLRPHETPKECLKRMERDRKF